MKRAIPFTAAFCGILSVLPVAVSAQSVLERVIQRIGGVNTVATTTGVFANIAETAARPGPVSFVTETVPATFANAPANTIIWFIDLGWIEGVYTEIKIRKSDVGSSFNDREGPYADLLAQAGIDEIIVGEGGTITVVDPDSNATASIANTSIDTPLSTTGGVTATPAPGASVFDIGGDGSSYLALLTDNQAGSYPNLYVDEVRQVTGSPYAPQIDGSIANIIRGAASAAAEVSDTVGSVALPTVDLGDMATTVLGAVNTGGITLGVNSSAEEAVAAASQAVSASVAQMGGFAGTGALVLNVAHNAAVIRGDVGNAMTAVNGSVGDVATTVLGAVNTGTITSGVGAAVQGIVGLPGRP